MFGQSDISLATEHLHLGAKGLNILVTGLRNSQFVTVVVRRNIRFYYRVGKRDVEKSHKTIKVNLLRMKNNHLFNKNFPIL